MGLYKRGRSTDCPWYMNFVMNGKRVNRSTGKSDRAEAELVEAQAKLDAAQSEGRGSMASGYHSLSLEDAIEYVYQNRWRYLKDGEQTKARLERVLSILGNLPLASLSSQSVTSVKISLRQNGLSSATINRYLAHLKTLLRSCRDEGMLSSIPSVKLEPEHNARTRTFTKAEEEAVVEWLQKRGSSTSQPSNYKHIGSLFILLIDTGMRLGEALSMTYSENIDLDRGYVYLYPRQTKNSKPRQIPLTKRVIQMLMDRQPANPGRPFPFDRFYVSRVLRECRDALGYEGDTEFVAHACRHTCASRLVDAGIDLYTVKDWLGHSSIKVTERYAHLNMKQLDKARDVLERRR